MSDHLPDPTVGLASWRFPDLVTTLLDSNELPTRTVARVAAEDLARGWSPESAVRRLSDMGEYAVAVKAVTELEDLAVMSAEQVERCREYLADARNKADEELTAKRHLLMARADRAGLELPSEVTGRVQVGSRRVSVEAPLNEAAAALAGAERDKEQRLLARIERHRRELPDGLACYLLDLVAAGEYRLAEEALKEPDDHIRIPVSVSEQPWPFRTVELVRICQWLSTSGAGQPLVRRYMPDDAAGQAMIAAIIDLPTGSRAAIAAYVAALQRLVADVDVAPPLEEEDGVLYTRLVLPDDPKLPQLAFTGREPVRFAVGREQGEAAFRLALDVVDNGSSTQVVVDVAAVLGLLVGDDDGKPRSREARLISLLRTICTQRGVGAVLAGSLSTEHPQRLRAHAWWLLYLLGHTLKSAQLDALLEVTGRHVPALLAVIRRMVPSKEFDLTAEREAAEFDKVLADAVRADLGDELFAMLSAIAMYQPADEQSLREYLLTLLGEASCEAAVDSMINVEETLARLKELRYLPHWSPDSVDLTPCGCGVVRALRRLPEAVVQDPVSRLVEQYNRSVEKRSHDALYRRVLEDTVHVWAGQHDPGPADDRANVSANRKVRRSMAEWMDPNQRFDLRLECEFVWRKMEACDRAVDVLFHSAAEATCVGRVMGLRLALENIIGNGVRAARATTRSGGSGTVTITLSVDSATRTALIEIADSGAGVPKHVYEVLESNVIPDSTEHTGSGGGLECARFWIESLGGTVRLMLEKSVLGGARFLISLPVVTGA
ncbi:ATP-binding protein [Amycolatopsis vastitatis]|nr:ATP-binding protein [Amycolatopsis vastitatis]